MHPWVALHGWAGVDVSDLPNLERWIDAVAERPAVRRGRVVPVVEDTPTIEGRAEELAKEGSKILGS